MREIKFRAWHINDKRWLWTGFEKYTSETHSDKPIKERDGRFWLTPQWTENSNDVVFQQFTGLKDKNNKDIYEGDILERVGSFDVFSSHPVNVNTIRKERIVVDMGVKHDEFGNITSGFSIQTQKSYSERTKPATYEIIGNIYENPELLNKQNHQ